MRHRAKEQDRHVASVVDALQILDCFRSQDSLGLKEIYQRTGINKSRILRFAGSLEACGLLVYDDRTRAYNLGSKLYYLGGIIEKRYSSLIAAVSPILEELVCQTGSVAYLSVRHGLQRLVLARRRPPDAEEKIIKDGQVRPLLLGANGRVLLAFEEAEERELILERLSEAGMLNGSLAKLAEAFTETRERGYAVAFGESKPRYFVVSVPLINRAGTLLGSIGLSTPMDGDCEAEAARQAELLLEAARSEALLDLDAEDWHH